MPGVAVLIAPAAFRDPGGADVPGEAAGLRTGCLYVPAGLDGGRFEGRSPLTVATGQVTASALLLLPLAAAVDRPRTLPAPSAGAWAALFGIALFGTALPYMIDFRDYLFPHPGRRGRDHPAAHHLPPARQRCCSASA